MKNTIQLVLGSLIVYSRMEEVTKLGPLQERFYWKDKHHLEEVGPHLSLYDAMANYRDVQKQWKSLQKNEVVQ